MKQIYYTKTVSERNRKYGYFEEKDFGEISIVELTEEEAPLMFKIDKSIIRKVKSKYITSSFTLPFSREEDAEYISKQGRFREKLLKKLGIRLREQSDDSYYPARSFTYYLVGKNLFSSLCPVSELSITRCGNITFGDWWSLGIEPRHQGKNNIPFTKERFLKELAKDKKRIATQNKGRTKKIYFSYPRVKWFDNQVNPKGKEKRC
ncbi:MAG: hypothetical protein Q8O10_10300 [candidate division Zixibacteria bacterium]|nr:hypothetical protein [candidate division Zixibacteria bacterium]